MQEAPRPPRSELIVHPTKSQRGPSTVLYLEPLGVNFGADEGHALRVEVWRVIRQKLPLFIALFMLGSLAGFVVSLFQTPVYDAHVSLEIQNPSDGTANLQIGDGAVISPESYLPTQVEILESRTLRRRARARLFDEKFQTGFKKSGPLDSLRRHLHLTSKSQPSGPPQSIPPVSVSVQLGVNTRIVQIRCESTDPQASAAYANALANEYIDSNLQARWDAINHARQWLAQQLDETRTKLQNSEDQLLAYGRASDLMFTGDKENAEQDKLKQVQAALSDAQADRIAKQSAYRIASSTPADSVPQVIDNARLSEYQAQLADLKRQLAELESEYTPEHPKVKRIQAQIDQLQATFQSERNNILTRIRSEYQAAVMRENLLNAAFRQQAQVVSEQTQKTINYNILERDVETNRQLYDSLLQKAREADVATAMRGSNARIIDTAEPSPVPAKPNVVWNTMLGALSGLLAGVALVLARESLDRSFKSPGEASLHLKLPELGVIPARNLAAGNGHGKIPRISILPSMGAARPNPQAGAVETATWRDKSSTIAESFRSAVTSILYSAENGAAPRVILISSALRGEGKTTVVSNLGIALAEINQKVLLIEGDMRKPRLNEVFNLPNDWGLSDLLREKTSLRDCPLEALVKRTELPDLSVLTSGPSTSSISNLLYSHRMLELLQRLRCEFDNILIDTPPMLDIADARILGRLADAAILVFRAGKTSREAAMAAKRRLTDDGIPLLGTILNAWDVRSMGHYGYGAYDYYSPPS